jgi:hypothetical protein
MSETIGPLAAGRRRRPSTMRRATAPVRTPSVTFTASAASRRGSATGPTGSDQRGTWYQPLDRRSRPRSPLSTRARIDFSIVAVEGRSRPPWRPRSGSLLSRQDLRPEGDLVGTRKARHTNAKSPGRSRGFPQPIGWRSEVALDAQTSAPLVLLARREWACLRTRCEGRDYPSRDDPETPTLVQV